MTRHSQAASHCHHWQGGSLHSHPKTGEFASGIQCYSPQPACVTCNTSQTNGVKILGAFDCNLAGHSIALLYKFGADNGIGQEELTANRYQTSHVTRHTSNFSRNTPASLSVRGLFPSQLLNGTLEQTAFTNEKLRERNLLLERLAGFEAQFTGTALSVECLAWRERLEVWQSHKFTA